MSHNLFSVPGLAFCTSCGATGTHHGRLLLRRCVQATATGLRNLVKIGKGLHPLSGNPLPVESPRPVPRERGLLPSIAAFSDEPALVQTEAVGPAPVPVWDQAEADPFADLDDWLAEAEVAFPALGEDAEDQPCWDEDPWLDPP